VSTFFVYYKKLIVVTTTTMDIANKDIWLEIVLYLDAVSAIHLRKASTFFAFIDNLYLIIKEEEVISCRHRGKLYGWTKYLDDSNNGGYCVRYDNGLITEQYRVIYRPHGTIIQINDVIYFDTHRNFNRYLFNDHVEESLEYDGPLVITQPINNTCPMPQFSDEADILAVSQNFLNLRGYDDNDSMIIIDLLRGDCAYCLNCDSPVFGDYSNTYMDWFGCCNAANLVSWYDNRETVLALLKIHDPGVYAIIHEKLALSIHEKLALSIHE
jgi:hypothetical protein